MSRIDFTLPHRQSSKGLILIFLQEGVKAIKSFWPVLLPLLLSEKLKNKLLILGIALAVALVLLVIHTILYYRNFRFSIENEQFVLRKGYLNRKTLTIPVERIQQVNTNQSVLQQFLGVMSVEIDTAGSIKKELKVQALERPEAVQLAMELSRYVESAATAHTGEDQKPVEMEQLIMRLTPRDLLRIGLSENHLRTALLIMVFGLQFFSQLQDYFKDKADAVADEAVEYVLHSGWAFLTALVLLFLLLSFVWSMIRTLVLYYDLHLYKRNRSYRIVSGLLNRKNLLVPFRKIQQLNWETGPVKRLFGIYKVNILQATGGLAEISSQIVMPGCLNPHLELVKADLFGSDILKDQPVIRSHPVYFRRTWMYQGWVPALIGTALMILNWQYVFLLIAWVIFMFFFSRLTLRKSYIQLNQHQIRVSSGAISHKFKQMEFSKVQHLEFRQSLFIRKRGLATLKIGNASGEITLPFIDAGIARKLHDYLLFYAETTDRENL